MRFRPEYESLLLSGRKTQTIRYTSEMPGHVFTVQGVEFRITETAEKHWSEMTVEDAHLDGFSTLEELHLALKLCYPSLNDITTRSFWAVSFEQTQGLEDVTAVRDAVLANNPPFDELWFHNRGGEHIKVQEDISLYKTSEDFEDACVYITYLNQRLNGNRAQREEK